MPSTSSRLCLRQNEGTRSIYLQKRAQKAKELAPWSRRCLGASFFARFCFLVFVRFIGGFANVFFVKSHPCCSLYPEIEYDGIEVSPKEKTWFRRRVNCRIFLYYICIYIYIQYWCQVTSPPRDMVVYIGTGFHVPCLWVSTRWLCLSSVFTSMIAGGMVLSFV